jgi:hypothetical protein
VLTTSPSDVRVEVLNGSGVTGMAGQAAAGLTRRGFDVTGTGDAASSSYTSSVIEYASAADLTMVNTLKKELDHVTERQDASLTPGTVELILGSDFTGLNPLPAQPSPTPTVQSSSTPTVQSSSTPSTQPPGTPGVQPSGTASAQPSASPSAVTGLAQRNGGITAAASCASDSSAFSGPLSP